MHNAILQEAFASLATLLPQDMAAAAETLQGRINAMHDGATRRVLVELRQSLLRHGK